MRQRYNNIVTIASALAVVALVGLPFVAGAQIDVSGVESDWEDILRTIRNIVDFAIPVIFAVGLVVFLWGLLKFLRAAADENAAEDGKRLIIWGVVIMFVMISVWGLTAIITQLIGIDAGKTPTLPQVPAARSGSGSGTGDDLLPPS